MAGDIDVDAFYNSAWEEEYQKELAKYGIQIDASLKDLLAMQLPVIQVKCVNCKHKWISEKGAFETEQSEVLSSPAYIHVKRKKKFTGAAVAMLVLINGALCKIMLTNGDEALIPTLVRHNSICGIYNKSSILSNHVSAMPVLDIEIDSGKVAEVTLDAKFQMK